MDLVDPNQGRTTDEDLYSFVTQIPGQTQKLYRSQVCVHAIFRSLPELSKLLVMRFLWYHGSVPYKLLKVMVDGSQRGNSREFQEQFTRLQNLRIAVLKNEAEGAGGTAGGSTAGGSQAGRTDRSGGGQPTLGGPSARAQGESRWSFCEVFTGTLKDIIQNGLPETELLRPPSNLPPPSRRPSRGELVKCSTMAWDRLLRYIVRTKDKSGSSKWTPSDALKMGLSELRLLRGAGDSSSSSSSSSSLADGRMSEPIFRFLLLDTRQQLMELVLKYLGKIRNTELGGNRPQIPGSRPARSDASHGTFATLQPGGGERDCPRLRHCLQLLFTLAHARIGQVFYLTRLKDDQKILVSLLEDLGLLWKAPEERITATSASSESAEERKKERETFAFVAPAAALLRHSGEEVEEVLASLSSSSAATAAAHPNRQRERGAPSGSGTGGGGGGASAAAPVGVDGEKSVVVLGDEFFDFPYRKREREGGDKEEDLDGLGRSRPKRARHSLFDSDDEDEPPENKDEGGRLSDLERGLVVETNFKIYAYTSSPVQVGLLKHFCEVHTTLGSMVICLLSRVSCARAFRQKVTAAQIIRFLQTHAHSAVLERQRMNPPRPIIPPNVVTQLKIWEKETKRLEPICGSVVKSFYSWAHFADALRWAMDHQCLVAHHEAGNRVFDQESRPMSMEQKQAENEMRAKVAQEAWICVKDGSGTSFTAYLKSIKEKYMPNRNGT
uniref:General transcription factor IIH subunit 4 n=1 Tax=Chromera velia CCMP2878 TaxID=1169474 RepID=A0A0G4FNU3_9ALVE|eukprot:Cvel_17986.t1-p1 / transcript=Cvel_17986.t1 / gene=Cvel_17986 / organism=Chromera_velia_CCMP2878 / gene_product=RNA polymerase II transcription factor B subunit 2, putative / transcript_product=RNA polymerase II transcription factor B subunit 2, putative / location=Cvel_scaffold1465:28749-36009(+) / protein_length=723 / sequence_SO=supercontig / SO=protein_coding / is_pseudo=false